jgi:hypothetical protein
MLLIEIAPSIKIKESEDQYDFSQASYMAGRTSTHHLLEEEKKTMRLSLEETRSRMLKLLDVTRHKTRLSLAGIDPTIVIHSDDRAWRFRDILGHIGVWNGEAAQSLLAHTEGGEYHCVPSEAKYDEYNGAAAEERRTWTIEQIWAEYDASCDQLKLLVGTMPDEKWNQDMLYPWNERGTIRNLVEVMMKHEVDHIEVVVKATS